MSKEQSKFSKANTLWDLIPKGAQDLMATTPSLVARQLTGYQVWVEQAVRWSPIVAALSRRPDRDDLPANLSRLIFEGLQRWVLIKAPKTTAIRAERSVDDLHKARIAAFFLPGPAALPFQTQTPNVPGKYYVPSIMWRGKVIASSEVALFGKLSSITPDVISDLVLAAAEASNTDAPSLDRCLVYYQSKKHMLPSLVIAPCRAGYIIAQISLDITKGGNHD